VPLTSIEREVTVLSSDEELPVVAQLKAAMVGTRAATSSPVEKWRRKVPPWVRDGVRSTGLRCH
jgi:hypothetical protein